VEWVSVAASAFGVSFLLLAILRPYDDAMLKGAIGVMIGQMGIGVVGAWLHIAGNLHAPGDSLLDRMIFGAPVFAPLLFANLAILGIIGLWEMRSVPVAPSLRASAALE
jgi:hypothetical protein